MDSKALRARLHQQRLRSAQLLGALKADTQSLEEHTLVVGQAKGRRDLGKEVARVFDALQLRAHERSVGAFEKLLSAILTDVVPEAGVVRMLPEYKSNTTWLDIALEKDGHLEDVLEGNGGAVTNVLCAGLRYAALLRTRNRRLMILDEGDCWIKRERVPAFVNVISRVSAQAKTQTFFISHHSEEVFEGIVNIVDFCLGDDGAVQAIARTPVVTSWSDISQPGIRAIELINFRRHKHTTVPCFPGATAYTGDVNLGKSAAIVGSFKAVAYGESSDKMIHHDADEATVILHLENNKRVEWNRSRKRSPSVIYKLWQGEVLLKEGRPKARNQVPDWISEELGISLVDDLDVQVRNQKEPVFLLNDTASRRAQILSVGKESGHLRTLMKKYEELRESDNEKIKNGELAIGRLNARVGYLAKAVPLDETLGVAEATSESILDALSKKEVLLILTEKISAAEAKVTAALKEVTALEDLPLQIPQLIDCSRLHTICKGLERAQAFQTVPPLPEMPSEPSMVNQEALFNIGRRLARAHQLVALEARLPEPPPPLPPFNEISALKESIDKMALVASRISSAIQEQATVEADVLKCKEDLVRTEESLGGVCPLCSGTLNLTHFQNPHAHQHA